MTSSNSNSEPSDLRAHHLQGFLVRPPRAEENGVLASFFPKNPLGTHNVLYLGAFGQPGDIPLGAAIVRAADVSGTNIGKFLIFVRPECRRRKIGTMLMRHVYSLAVSNKAHQLVLPDLVHENREDNAFYRSCGMFPDREFATYSVEINRALAFCDPILQRYESDGDLANTRIERLDTLNRAEIAHFFTTHGATLADEYLGQLEAGVYDLSLCCAAIHENRIIASGLGRSRPDVPSVMLDYMLTAPPYRNGPIPLAILAYSARIALQRKLTHCVFEADERYDRFAVGFARRCGAKPQWKRFRYSISREQMQAWLSNKS